MKFSFSFSGISLQSALVLGQIAIALQLLACA
jgi:hypothetical protein